MDVPTRTLGLPQQFLRHGEREQLLHDVGLDVASIAAAVAAALPGRPHAVAAGHAS